MKPFSTITAALLILIALLHVLRIWQGWIVTVDGIAVPLWASAVGFVVASVLAIGLWRETRK